MNFNIKSINITLSFVLILFSSSAFSQEKKEFDVVLKKGATNLPPIEEYDPNKPYSQRVYPKYVATPVKTNEKPVSNTAKTNTNKTTVDNNTNTKSVSNSSTSHKNTSSTQDVNVASNTEHTTNNQEQSINNNYSTNNTNSPNTNTTTVGTESNNTTVKSSTTTATTSTNSTTPSATNVKSNVTVVPATAPINVSVTPTKTYKLKVSITDIDKNNKQPVLCFLFRKTEQFPDPIKFWVRNSIVPASNKADFSFLVPYGEYAIFAYQDMNNSGKYDKGDEIYGVSGQLPSKRKMDNKDAFFEACKINFQGENQEVIIKLINK